MINYLEDHSIYQVGKQNVAKTMPCLPPMTGNGKFIPPIKMLINLGMARLWHCFTH